jgi:hypothetical protein
VICLIIGGILGFVSGAYFDGLIGSYMESSNFPIVFIKLFGLIAIFIAVFWVQIILHELGHLIFGLMSGYSFVSFRVGSFTIINDNGKLKRKKFNIPGTGGQCLMMPPELKDERFPFILYNLGGVIMNLTTFILGILIAKNVNSPFNIIFSFFSLIGLFTALTNGIPMKIGGIANDAYNILSMLKNKDTRQGFYVQLRVNGLQSQGMRIKDMPLDTFEVKDDSDLSNPLNTSLRLMEFNWYLDNMDFEKGKKSLDTLLPYFDKIIPVYRNEINCERMFLELVGNCDKHFIDNLYNKNLKKYIKIAKFMINKTRILMAYEAFYNEDKFKAMEYYKKIYKLADKYPIKGEADMELMLADWIKEKINC